MRGVAFIVFHDGEPVAYVPVIKGGPADGVIHGKNMQANLRIAERLTGKRLTARDVEFVGLPSFALPCLADWVEETKADE